MEQKQRMLLTSMELEDDFTPSSVGFGKVNEKMVISVPLLLDLNEVLSATPVINEEGFTVSDTITRVNMKGKSYTIQKPFSQFMELFLQVDEKLVKQDEEHEDEEDEEQGQIVERRYLVGLDMAGNRVYGNVY